mmetsp:Transcript_61280/g.200364  ORF Transcript_61280/g.200364 Transcript_61280/m.200364 type:complete len:228 (-) Transcript_61280:514-1197(-)
MPLHPRHHACHLCCQPRPDQPTVLSHLLPSPHHRSRPCLSGRRPRRRRSGGRGTGSGIEAPRREADEAELRQVEGAFQLEVQVFEQLPRYHRTTYPCRPRIEVVGERTDVPSLGAVTEDAGSADEQLHAEARAPSDVEQRGAPAAKGVSSFVDFFAHWQRRRRLHGALQQIPAVGPLDRKGDRTTNCCCGRLHLELKVRGQPCVDAAAADVLHGNFVARITEEHVGV